MTAIATNSIYSAVFEKYGITTLYDRLHWIYRDDAEQIRKDLLDALLDDFRRNPSPRAVALAPHYHEEDFE